MIHVLYYQCHYNGASANSWFWSKQFYPQEVIRIRWIPDVLFFYAYLRNCATSIDSYHSSFNCDWVTESLSFCLFSDSQLSFDISTSAIFPYSHFSFHIFHSTCPFWINIRPWSFLLHHILHLQSNFVWYLSFFYMSSSHFQFLRSFLPHVFLQCGIDNSFCIFTDFRLQKGIIIRHIQKVLLVILLFTYYEIQNHFKNEKRRIYIAGKVISKNDECRCSGASGAHQIMQPVGGRNGTTGKTSRYVH